jgi:hypothetical protein
MKDLYRALFALLLIQFSLQAGPLDTWNVTTIPSIQAYYYDLQVAYGDGQFLLLANGDDVNNYTNEAATSPDGVNWTPATFPPLMFTSSPLRYGNGTFVITGEDDNFNLMSATSADGMNWTINSLPTGVDPATMGLTFGNGVFLLFSGGGAWSSTNGLEWSSANLSSGFKVTRSTCAHGEFIAIGTDTQNNLFTTATSPDGLNWTSLGASADIVNAINPHFLLSLEYANCLYCLIGFPNVPYPDSSPSAMWTSPDALHWTSVVKFPQPYGISGITYGYGKMVAIGVDYNGNTVSLTSGQCIVPMSQGGSSQRTYFPIPASDQWGSLIYAKPQYDAFVQTQQNLITNLTGQAQWDQQAFVTALIDRETNYTIRSVGCKLTSLCMALQYLGYTRTPDGNPLTPRFMNSWLEASGGYSQIRSLNPGKYGTQTNWANNNTARPRFNGADIDELTKTFLEDSYPGLTISHPHSESDVTNALYHGEPVMLRVDGGKHSIFAFDYILSADRAVEYEVIDPAHTNGAAGTIPIGDGISTIPSRPTRCLEDMDAIGCLNDSWILSKSGVPDGCSLVQCPLGITIQDPSGNIATFTAASGLTTNQINGAAFSVVYPNADPDDDPWTDSDTSNYISSFPPMLFTIPANSMQQKGSYQITATGLQSGSYNIFFDGPYIRPPLNASGTIAQNQSAQFNALNIPSIKLGISTTPTNTAITLAGPAGNYNVYSSTNLVSWNDIGSVTVDTNNQAVFNDRSSPALMKFYKVKSE